MNIRPKITIGLDLGTASVGWAILEQKSQKIIDMGVRLFSDDSLQKSNQDRRENRSTRRLIRRKKVRLQDLIKLLIKYQIVKDDQEFNDFINRKIFKDDDLKQQISIVELKLAGLKTKLTNWQLVKVLYHYLKHRGKFNDVVFNDQADEQKLTNLTLNLYNPNLLPSENQYQSYLKSDQTIGQLVNYAITNQAWQNEISLLLKQQDLDQNFIDEYLKLFARKRAYWEGPGSEKSYSPYGRFDEDGNWLGGNLWDTKIAKDTYLPNEKRHLKRAPLSELYNLLNQLATVLVVDQTDEDFQTRHLDEKEKWMIIANQAYTTSAIKKLLKLKLIVNPSILYNIKDVKKDFEINKDIMKTTKVMIKQLSLIGFDFKNHLLNLDDYLKLDDIFYQISQWQDDENRTKQWKIISDHYHVPISDETITNLNKLPIWTNGTAALSKLTMQSFIEFALCVDGIGVEQMTYFSHHFAKSAQTIKQQKYLDRNYFVNSFLPPVVQKSIKNAIDVINALIKKYANQYLIDQIVIELARELNSNVNRRRIESNQLRAQKNYLKLLKEVGLDRNLNASDKEKLILWKDQCGIDLYDGQTINLKIDKNSKTIDWSGYEVDHIIPYSKCFKDAKINKILTKTNHNQLKANLTPYQWMQKGDFEQLQRRVEHLIANISDRDLKSYWEVKARDYLLNTKVDLESGFINSQLNDTRYATRLLFNYLKGFFKTNPYWCDQDEKPLVKVKNLNGQVTSYVRYQILNQCNQGDHLIKNRYLFWHHAIDAAILAWTMTSFKIPYLNTTIRERKINWTDGTISFSNYKIHRDLVIAFKKQLDKWSDYENEAFKIKFSRQLKRKNNFAFSNQTLYTYKIIDDRPYQTYRVDLKTLTVEQGKKYFDPEGKNYQDVLTFKDKNLREQLLKIWNQYCLVDHQIGDPITSTNNHCPFQAYFDSKQVQNFLSAKGIDVNYLNSRKIPILWTTKNQKVHWVEAITCVNKSPKNLDKVILNHKQNNRSFYDSINCNGYRIYANQAGEPVVVYLSILNQKIINQKAVVDEDKLKQMLDDLNVVNRDHYSQFINGSYLINDYGDLFYIAGGSQAKSKLLIKPVAMNSYFVREFTKWKDAPKRGKIENGKVSGEQWQMGIKEVVKLFKKCQVDILGNVKKIEKIL